MKIDKRPAKQEPPGSIVEGSADTSIAKLDPSGPADLDDGAIASHARDSRSTRPNADDDLGQNMDPRLRRVTKLLLRAVPKNAGRSNSSADDAIARVRSTVTKLWPQHTVDTIYCSHDVYRDKTTTPPLMTSAQFVDSLRDHEVPPDISDSLALINVQYRGFDGEVRTGQIVGHKDVEDSIRVVFRRILQETDFPMTCVTPVSRFGWSDASSVMFNNSSGFNWRLVAGSHEVSDHAFGGAIDINPMINPWVKNNTMNSRYDPEVVGTLSEFTDVVKIFKDEGWKWGGDWKNSKDWQHFYRPEIPLKYFGKHEVPE